MSALVLAALAEAWAVHGPWTGDQPEVARWVQARVQAIRAGDTTVPPMPVLPVKTCGAWYEREPGCDDE